MRFPLEIVAKEPRTINAWVRPKVTEGRQTACGVFMKKRATVPMLVRAPADQSDRQSGDDPGGKHADHAPTGSVPARHSISRRADSA